MSVRPLLPAVLVLVLAGCGSAPKPERALSPVRLTVDGPPDPVTTDAATVEVHGRVFPSTATVLVSGNEAGVSRGAFSAVVELDEGSNIVDIQAGAPRRAAAMTALRVTRRAPVTIPDVSGRPPDEAVDALHGLGLQTKVRRGGGLLDDLLPGTIGVCRTDPADGERVKPGSTVVVEVAKVC